MFTVAAKKKQIVRKEEARERSKVGSENRFARTDLSKRVARATKERQARGLQHMSVLVAEKKGVSSVSSLG